MFFTQPYPHKKFNNTSDFFLEAGHVCIKADLVQKIFQEEETIFITYYPEKKQLFMAPANEELFKTIHKAKQKMLKKKNALGDKSFNVQDLLDDNNINIESRDLEFTVQEALRIAMVVL